MFYTGCTNEKTDKKKFQKSLKTFDYIKELVPLHESHVSFNKRAYTAEKYEYSESVKQDILVESVLISYNTIVCGWSKKDGFVRYWGDWSSTTMRHINEFRKQLEYPSISKKAWENLPVKNWEE